jgi:hypothetical protein
MNSPHATSMRSVDTHYILDLCSSQPDEDSPAPLGDNFPKRIRRPYDLKMDDVDVVLQCFQCSAAFSD